MIGKNIFEVDGEAPESNIIRRSEDLMRSLFAHNILRVEARYALFLAGNSAYNFIFKKGLSVADEMAFELLIPVADPGVDLTQQYKLFFLQMLEAYPGASISTHMNELSRDYRFILWSRYNEGLHEKLRISFCSEADFADLPRLMLKRLSERHLSHLAAAVHLSSPDFSRYHAGEEICFLTAPPAQQSIEYARALSANPKAHPELRTKLVDIVAQAETKEAQRAEEEERSAKRAAKLAKKEATLRQAEIQRQAKKAARAVAKEAAKKALEETVLKQAQEEEALAEAAKTAALPPSSKALKKHKKKKKGVVAAKASAGGGSAGAATVAVDSGEVAKPGSKLKGGEDPHYASFFHHVLLPHLDLETWLSAYATKECFSWRDEHGFTALELAVIYVQLDKVLYLLKAMNRFGLDRKDCLTQKTKDVMLASICWESNFSAFKDYIDGAPEADQEWLINMQLMKFFNPLHVSKSAQYNRFDSKHGTEHFTLTRLLCLLGFVSSHRNFEHYKVPADLINILKPLAVDQRIIEVAKDDAVFYPYYQIFFALARRILLTTNKTFKLSKIFSWKELDAYYCAHRAYFTKHQTVSYYWIVSPLLYQILRSPFSCSNDQVRWAMKTCQEELAPQALLLAVHRGEPGLVDLILPFVKDLDFRDPGGSSVFDVLFERAYTPPLEKATLESDDESMRADLNRLLEAGDLIALKKRLSKSAQAQRIVSHPDFKGAGALSLVLAATASGQEKEVAHISMALKFILIFQALSAKLRASASIIPAVQESSALTFCRLGGAGAAGLEADDSASPA